MKPKQLARSSKVCVVKATRAPCIAASWALKYYECATLCSRTARASTGTTRTHMGEGPLRLLAVRERQNRARPAPVYKSSGLRRAQQTRWP